MFYNGILVNVVLEIRWKVKASGYQDPILTKEQIGANCCELIPICEDYDCLVKTGNKKPFKIKKILLDNSAKVIKLK